MKLSKEQINKYARWYCTLNHWEWPDDLDGKPYGWDELPDCYPKDGRTKYNCVDPIMNNIRAIIGEKECLKYHHLNNLHRTRLQFERWWFWTEYIVKFFIKYFPKHRDFIITLYYKIW